MGVEYRHLIVPADRGACPSAPAIGALVGALGDGGWLPSIAPGVLAPLACAGDVVVRLGSFGALGAPARYPFDDASRSADAYWDLALHRADPDPALLISDQLDPVSAIACACGAPLEYATDELDPPQEDEMDALRVRSRCLACGAPLDPRGFMTDWIDGYGGDRLRIATPLYRFAVVIDCGKSLPTPPPRGSRLGVQTELRERIERLLGLPMDQVGYLY